MSRESDRISDAMFWLEQGESVQFAGATWTAEQSDGAVSRLMKDGETVLTVGHNVVFDEAWHIALEAALWCARPQGKMMSLDYEGKK